MRPPVLTDRQLQILEFVAAGATRKEIAVHLKISPETVKDHVKVIFDKFGVQSLRDGFSEISQYLQTYGQHGLNAKQFFTDVTYRVDVAENRTSAKLYRASNGYIVHGKVDTFSTRLIDNGELLNVKLNGQKPSQIRISDKFMNYAITLDKPIAAGERFSRTFEAQLKRKNNAEYTETSNTIGTPVEKLTIDVRFPYSVPQCSGYLERGLDALDFAICKHVEFDFNQTRALAIIHWPQISDRYCLNWLWQGAK